jgi:uncharacterized caspase-like protein
MTTDPLACRHGPHPAMPNVHDVTAALAREQQKSARLWGLLRAKGMTDDQIQIRVTDPEENP